MTCDYCDAEDSLLTEYPCRMRSVTLCFDCARHVQHHDLEYLDRGYVLRRVHLGRKEED